MYNRIFRCTLIFLLACSTLSPAYAQERTDQPCWENIVSGKLRICLAYPENFQTLMMQSPDMIAKYVLGLATTPKVFMLKKLGLILDEVQKARAAHDPKEYQKNVRGLQKNIRSICSQDDYHCSAPSFTSDEIAAGKSAKLLYTIESNTVDLIQAINKEESTRIVDARSGTFIKNIRRDAELLAVCNTCSP